VSNAFDTPATPKLYEELGIRKVDPREFDAGTRRAIRDIERSAVSCTAFEETATGRIVLVVHHGTTPTEVTVRQAVSKGRSQ
jgi:hypothetical protein